jgi:hypothetical protein
MSSPPAPAAPDYTGAAKATAASNQEAQTQADWANRPTVNTPWGQESWQSAASIDPATGKQVTSWTQNQTLNPQSQATLDAQLGVDRAKSETALGQFGRVQDAMATPFDWGSLSGYGQAPQAGGVQAGNLTGAGQGIMGSLDTGGLGAMPTADDAGRQRIEQALLARMQPQNQQDQAALEGKLSNMGLTRGSTAWNRELQRLGDQQSRQSFDAMNTAGEEQSRQFGMGMQGRQQGWSELLGAGNFQNAAQAQGFGQEQSAGNQNFQQDLTANAQNYNQGMQGANYANALRQQQIAEQAQQRNMPLNELNALLSGTQVGQLQTPDFNASQSAGGVDYSGAAGQQYNAAMNAYSAQQAQKQGLMSGLTGLAGAGMMAFSDRRLKSNIVRVGTHPLGIGIFDYDIFGRRERGVMAQDLVRVAPQHVHIHPSGYFVVDYEGH